MTKKRKSLFGDALSNLAEAMEQREKELDDREEKLQQYEKRLKAEHSLAYGETTPGDVLHLNIGGTKTTVLRRTLTSVPGSMLASRFSGRWDDSIEKDNDGNFFIDQDFTLFNIMLTYLRNKGNGDDKFPMASPIFGAGSTKFDFYRMVEYYGMTEGIYPTKLQPLRLKSASVKMTGPKKFVSRKWKTFELALEGHSRKIKTYEVTLGEVHRFQIGWGYSCHFSSKEEDLGVGEVAESFALDFTRSMFLINRGSHSSSTTEAVEGLEHPVGTVVLSQDYGRRWFVNGELVFDAKGKEVNYGRNAPLISIKGQFEVTTIELDN